LKNTLLSKGLLCPLLTSVLLSELAVAQTSSVTPEVIERASKAVVLFKGTSEAGTILGSGFIISPDGKIATNLHVIRNMKAGAIQLPSGETYDSFSVVAFDDRKDMAIVQVAGFDLPTVALGNSNEIRVGEPVVAIGSPQGLQGTVTAGVVSSVRDDPAAGGFKVIQTDAAANPGNSGGPLITAKGEVIGMVTSKLRASEGLNFAVPINYIRGLLSGLGKPITLEALRAALESATSDVFKEGSALPANWKSIVSGNRFKIRQQGDLVYIERVLPEEAVRVGAFSGWELRKGKNGYSGTERVVIPCSYNATDWNTLGPKQIVNRSTFEYQVEVSLVSATRIEGRLLAPPSDAHLNCKKRTFDKSDSWQNFTWIPE
jgi:S1-C subfamily serine protease